MDKFSITLSTTIISSTTRSIVKFITDLKQRALSYVTQENDKEAFKKDFDDLKNKKAENVSKTIDKVEVMRI